MALDFVRNADLRARISGIGLVPTEMAVDILRDKTGSEYAAVKFPGASGYTLVQDLKPMGFRYEVVEPAQSEAEKELNAISARWAKAIHDVATIHPTDGIPESVGASLADIHRLIMMVKAAQA